MYFEPVSSTAYNFPVTLFHIGENIEQLPVNRPDGYNWHMFLWVTKGEGYLELGDIKTTFVEGQGFFTKSNIPYSYFKTGEEFSTQWVAFSSNDVIFEYFNPEDYFLFNVPDYLKNATLQLEKLCKSHSAATRAAQTYLWVTELFEKLSENKMSFSESITDYLEQNCQKQITLEELSKKFSMDKYMLCRKFSHDTGETVIQTLKTIRIDKAKNLLRHCDYTVEDIAWLCGYESPSYFIKIFRECTGTTPNQY
ncbi:MAG: helix-turn-helix transcriptional regulator, partial [Clostridia bacterium]|nr:helix-turn-helix transcriptional regulator [Clostridia bacterium]